MEGDSGAVGLPYPIRWRANVIIAGSSIILQPWLPGHQYCKAWVMIFVWILVAVSNTYDTNVFLFSSEDLGCIGSLWQVPVFHCHWCGSSLGGAFGAWEEAPPLDAQSPTVHWEVASALVWGRRKWNNKRNNKRIPAGLRAWKLSKACILAAKGLGQGAPAQRCGISVTAAPPTRSPGSLLLLFPGKEPAGQVGYWNVVRDFISHYGLRNIDTMQLL